MEMMTQLEGPIVDSLYDVALISWHKALEPPLPSHNSPAALGGLGSFGAKSYHEMFPQGNLQPSVIPEAQTGSSGHLSTQTELRESKHLVNRSSGAPHEPSPAINAVEHAVDAKHLPPQVEVSTQGTSSGLINGQTQLGKDAATNAYLRAGSTSLPSCLISQPAQVNLLPEHLATDPHYDIDVAGEVARVQQSVSAHDNLTRLEAITAHLNHTKNPDFPSSIPEIPAGDEFTPYIPHAVHEPFPMAMVNRPPYGTPNNNDVYTPQNEAWLAGLRYAKKNVFIQSPTLNAEPILKEILNACERGVDVFAFICIGYNDAVRSHTSDCSQAHIC